MKEEKIILGVDPGLNTTGYGVIEISSDRPRLLEAGVVHSSSKTPTGRIKDIYDGIVEVVKAFHPDVLVLEQLYSHYKRPITAILMGHARGVICLAAEQAGIPVVSYAATKIKKTMTGSGRAPKDQMQRAVQFELRLSQKPEPPDVADAIAIAFCHFAEARQTLRLGDKANVLSIEALSSLARPKTNRISPNKRPQLNDGKKNAPSSQSPSK